MKEDDVSPKGRIPLYVILSCENGASEGKNAHILTLNTPVRDFVLSFNSKADLEKWENVLKSAILSSQALTLGVLFFGEEGDLVDQSVKKVLTHVIPLLIAETRVSCRKVLASLLASNKSHFS